MNQPTKRKDPHQLLKPNPKRPASRFVDYVDGATPEEVFAWVATRRRKGSWVLITDTIADARLAILQRGRAHPHLHGAMQEVHRNSHLGSLAELSPHRAVVDMLLNAGDERLEPRDCAGIIHIRGSHWIVFGYTYPHLRAI